MKLITFLSIIVFSSAAQLPSRNYLPQNQASNSFGTTAHGSFQQSSFNSQSFQSSQSSGFAGGSLSGDTGNRRPQQDVEKKAAILKQDQDVSEHDFHYSYETSNGIRAEQSGNTVQSQGGFSYTGDDGNTYSVTFTAGEGGFRPQGAHLPVSPPIPEEILLGLQQNEKDEAAGIFDDGQYRADIHGSPQKGGSKPGLKGPAFSSSSGQAFGSSSSSSFGSANHQSSFNPNSGYKY